MCDLLLRSAALAALVLLGPSVADAKNLLSADGPGGTYELIRTAYSTELPDCGHAVPHITEAFDDELNKNVFIFHAHVNQDDDRCGATDRQRTEIRARAADIIANNGETVYYRWKFKLPSGFQGAPSFTHIFQIKSNESAPIMTLTPRTTTLAIDGRIGERGSTSLSKFIGVWVVVDLKVVFSNTGELAMTIRRISNGDVLFDYSGNADMWDDNASGHDAKFGIYRSLNNRDMLRDEQVRFADFCASKQSANECADTSDPTPSVGGAGGTNSANGGAPANSGSGGKAEANGGSSPLGTGGSSGREGENKAGASNASGGTATDTPDGRGGADAAGRPGTSETSPDQASSADSDAGCSCQLGRQASNLSGSMLLLATALVWFCRRSRNLRGKTRTSRHRT